LGELRGTKGGNNQLSIERHWEAEIELTQRCIQRASSSEVGDALREYDLLNFEAIME